MAATPPNRPYRSGSKHVVLHHGLPAAAPALACPAV
jgi:hypothetical protein